MQPLVLYAVMTACTKGLVKVKFCSSASVLQKCVCFYFVSRVEHSLSSSVMLLSCFVLVCGLHLLGSLAPTAISTVNTKRTAGCMHKGLTLFIVNPMAVGSMFG